MVLRKASVSESLPPLRLPLAGEDIFSFKEGDFVKISVDKEVVRQLQAGHGEWVESMTQVGGYIMYCQLSCFTYQHVFKICLYLKLAFVLEQNDIYCLPPPDAGQSGSYSEGVP